MVKSTQWKNTKEIHYSDGSYVVSLHGNDIIRFLSSGRVVLDSCGWRSVTTKRCMNQYLDHLSVYQEDKTWYVSNGKVVAEFFDGMVVSDDGSDGFVVGNV